MENMILTLKEQQGKDMVVWGSLSIAQSLINAGLIDEYQLRIVPILLRSGKPMFSTSEGKELSLELMKSKSYPSGITLFTYKPVQ